MLPLQTYALAARLSHSADIDELQEALSARRRQAPDTLAGQSGDPTAVRGVGGAVQDQNQVRLKHAATRTQGPTPTPMPTPESAAA